MTSQNHKDSEMPDTPAEKPIRLVADFLNDNNLSEDAILILDNQMRFYETDIQKRSLDLEEKRIDVNREISLRQLDFDERSRKEKELTKRYWMIAIVSIITTAFIYSGLTKDTALSDKVINTLFGALGGLGAGAVVFQKDKDKNNS